MKSLFTVSPSRLSVPPPSCLVNWAPIGMGRQRLASHEKPAFILTISRGRYFSFNRRVPFCQDYIAATINSSSRTLMRKARSSANTTLKKIPSVISASTRAIIIRHRHGGTAALCFGQTMVVTDRAPRPTNSPVKHALSLENRLMLIFQCCFRFMSRPGD